MTYERSRDARLEEAQTDARDVYALVYDADRPELFLKDAECAARSAPAAIRVAATRAGSCPEPELGVVLGEGGEPVAVTIGNDVSSRDIEGANPLYIPQAKIFAGRVRDRPGARRARRLGRAVSDPPADHRTPTGASSSPARRRRRR